MRDKIESLMNAIDAKDTNKFISFLTDDCTFTFGNSMPVIGKEAIFNSVSAFFNSIASLRHTIPDYCQCNDRVVFHGEVTYTRHNGSELTVKYCNYFYMQGELISSYNIFADISELYS